MIGLAHYTKADDGTITDTVFDINGLIYSFMLSIGNDSAWLPVITASTSRCYDQYGGNDEGMDCGVIPVSIYDVIECSLVENFLKCANWNPYNIAECDYTYQYIQKCSGVTNA